MDSTFMGAVRARTDAAIASGDLQPIVAEQVVMRDAGLPFTVRWVAALAAKDAAKAGATPATTLPGGPRDPNFNPFLPPDPALTVGPLGAHHNVVLNKFPVCLHHLVLARREFAEQLSPLELVDFLALAIVLSDAGGLGFYNGGAAAGASQRHKHVQWIPAAEGNASLRYLGEGLPADIAPGALARHPGLPLRHCFVRVEAGFGCDPEAAAQAMHDAFGRACAELSLVPGGEDGLLPPCNMLVGDGWMLVLPRSREHFEGVSLNALSYGGTVYVREPAQIEAIRAVGPLRALASVGIPEPGPAVA
ncbi:phosphorylase [Castellaniella sp. GW247-6E4]|uniref:ATP adenylyltransferase family protein n=1 Tax=Castellaniella sp. GW247-6E4 TaxID=3140380 RepID=UPI0033147DAF